MQGTVCSVHMHTSSSLLRQNKIMQLTLGLWP